MPDLATARPLRVAVDLGPPVLRAGVLAILARYPRRMLIVVTHGEPEVIVQLAGTRTADQREQRRDAVAVLTLTWPDGRDDAAHPPGATLSLGASADEVVRAVELAHARGAGASRRRTPGGSDTLSPRERDVLRLICRGMSNREMAEHLMLTVNSVKTHVRLAYLKMSVDSRSRAVLWGIEHGYAAREPAVPDLDGVPDPAPGAGRRPHAETVPAREGRSRDRAR